MLLTIDIGNTEVAAGIFHEEELVAHWRISSNITRTEDETWSIMYSICQALGYDLKKVTGVAISSVVPDHTIIFEKMVQKYNNCDPVVVHSDLDLGIVISYETPASVGADRLCNAVAGYQKHGGPLIIVDFGTATTFDVISENGEYLGGAIAPGIETASRMMHLRAAKLPSISLRFPENVIGRTTEHSMQAGIMYGAVDIVNGLSKRINQEMDGKASFIATGGLAKLLLDKLDNDFILEPYLTLKGLQFVYKRIRK